MTFVGRGGCRKLHLNLPRNCHVVRVSHTTKRTRKDVRATRSACCAFCFVNLKEQGACGHGCLVLLSFLAAIRCRGDFPTFLSRGALTSACPASKGTSNSTLLRHRYGNPLRSVRGGRELSAAPLGKHVKIKIKTHNKEQTKIKIQERNEIKCRYE